MAAILISILGNLASCFLADLQQNSTCNRTAQRLDQFIKTSCVVFTLSFQTMPVFSLEIISGMLNMYIHTCNVHHHNIIQRITGCWQLQFWAPPRFAINRFLTTYECMHVLLLLIVFHSIEKACWADMP